MQTFKPNQIKCAAPHPSHPCQNCNQRHSEMKIVYVPIKNFHHSMCLFYKIAIECCRHHDAAYAAHLPVYYFPIHTCISIITRTTTTTTTISPNHYYYYYRYNYFHTSFAIVCLACEGNRRAPAFHQMRRHHHSSTMLHHNVCVSPLNYCLLVFAANLLRVILLFFSAHAHTLRLVIFCH